VHLNGTGKSGQFCDLVDFLVRSLQQVLGVRNSFPPDLRCNAAPHVLHEETMQTLASEANMIHHDRVHDLTRPCRRAQGKREQHGKT